MMLYISSDLLQDDFANESSADRLDDLEVTLPQKRSAWLVHRLCVNLLATKPYYSKDEMTVTGIPFPVNHTLPWTFLCSLGE